MNQIVKFFLKDKKQLAYFIGKIDINSEKTLIEYSFVEDEGVSKAYCLYTKPYKISFSPFLNLNDSPLMRAFHISANFLVIIIIFFSLESCGKSENKYQPKTENIKKGESLFTADGCFACHSIKSEVKYGPALNNILDTKINVIRKSGQYAIIVNREYILRSIKDPAFEKMIGFQKKRMPQPTISEEDINFLVDYIISINLKHTGKLYNKEI